MWLLAEEMQVVQSEVREARFWYEAKAEVGTFSRFPD
jgi:hypothetical protein